MFFLFLLFVPDEVLVLNNGAILECASWSRNNNFVVLERQDGVFSLPLRLVDWGRTRSYRMPTKESKRIEPQTPAPILEKAEKELVIAVLEVRKTSLIDLIRFLADMANVNLYIDSSVVDSKVTYHLRNLPWKTVMRMVCLNAGLSYDVIGGTLLVRDH